jgi:hypothetical protein
VRFRFDLDARVTFNEFGGSRVVIVPDICRICARYDDISVHRLQRQDFISGQSPPTPIQNGGSTEGVY